MKFLASLSTLQLALGVSVAVHAGLLTIRFVDSEAFNRVFQDTPLEVILVNARTNDVPERARAIAQANMAGGGDVDKGRATTPLPPSALQQAGDTHEERTEAQLRAMQEQQALLLAQVRQQLAMMPMPDQRKQGAQSEQKAQEERRRRLEKLLAEIERRINEENARPKKRYVSPATREAVYAVYYDQLRRSIEERGTQNFPEAQGRKLYGELTMVVTVNHNGRVLATEIVESSGNAQLDRRAEAIARGAGPFGEFTPAMRRQADQIVVVSRFKFTREETLETQVSAQ